MARGRTLFEFADIAEGKETSMINGKTIALVMPCRNEGGHLQRLIDKVPSFFDEIICVSNKSTDNTVEVGQAIAQKNPRFVFLVDDRTAGGIGYGYAHMTGISHATCDYIVCADSDGTYPVDQTSELLETMQRRGLLFVSCSRYPDKSIPLKLQLGVKILNAEIALLYGFRISDSLSGMWVFSRDVVSSLHLTEGDWNLSPQIKLNAKKYLKNRFAEIKVVQRKREGETKQDYFKTGFAHLCWIAKNRFRSPRELQPAD